MKTFHVLQGSPEWQALRLGRPTGSQFDRIVTPAGNASGEKTQEKFMFELLGERMTGRPDEDFQSKWMERGQTLEIDAVHFYEAQRDMDTTPIGFMMNDAETIGASPDRLVGDAGLMEIKCPSAGIHVSYLLKSGSHYEKYKVQVQGQLWISGREWCDVVSFHDRMPMALIRIPRDEKFIGIMGPLIEAFSARLEMKAEELRQLGWLTDAKPGPAFSPETDRAYEAWHSSGSQAEKIEALKQAMSNR